MKILITGNGGRIGAEAMEHLDGHDLWGYDLKVGDNILNYGHLRTAMDGKDMVVHLAAIPHPHVDFSASDYFEQNVCGTMNVVEAAVEAGLKRIIYASSTAYYGVTRATSKVKIFEGADDFTKNIVPNDQHPSEWYYASSKVAAEALLSSFGLSKQIEVVILRFAPCHNEPSLIPGIRQGFGTYVHTRDTARAIQAAIDYKSELWFERFNINSTNKEMGKANKILFGLAELTGET